MHGLPPDFLESMQDPRGPSPEFPESMQDPGGPPPEFPESMQDPRGLPPEFPKSMQDPHGLPPDFPESMQDLHGPSSANRILSAIKPRRRTTSMAEGKGRPLACSCTDFSTRPAARRRGRPPGPKGPITSPPRSCRGASPGQTEARARASFSNKRERAPQVATRRNATPIAHT